MTWFEEWFLYFEWSYGHTAVRTIDIEKIWDMDYSDIIRIKNCKLAIEVSALQSWPCFSSL